MVTLTGNTVELADDDEVVLGSGNDAKIIYESATDKLVFVDDVAAQDLLRLPMDGTSNVELPNRAPDITSLSNISGLNVANLDGSSGTAGQVLQTDGTNLSFQDISASGNFSDALSNGQALADDGNLYSSIQDAENAATDYIFIGPGTFTESVTIDTSGLNIIGSGEGTVVDGGSNAAFDIQASNIDIEAIQFTLNIDTYIGAVNTGAVTNVSLKDCFFVAGSGTYAIDIGAVTNFTVDNCLLDTGRGPFYNVSNSADDIVIKDTYTNYTTGFGPWIDAQNTPNVKIRDNYINYSGADAPMLIGSDSILDSNTIITSGDSGGAITVSGADTVVSNNNITTDGNSVQCSSSGTRVKSNEIESGGTAVDITQPDMVTEGNIITNPGTNGVELRSSADDCIIVNNQIRGAGDKGIFINSVADNIVANNRVYGSTNSNIDDSTGTRTALSANITGT